MTTPQQRVRALVKAIADLRRGDLEAVLDLDHYVRVHRGRHYDYATWEYVEGVTSHKLGQIWELYLVDIIRAGATERRPPRPIPIRTYPIWSPLEDEG